MALFRKFFYRKLPDGLLEVSERVYVFDCCFTTDVLEDDKYKVYIGSTVSQLHDHFPDSSFMVFNFREGEHQSFLTDIFSEYDMTVMDYPQQYEGCPLLTMEMIHHFLRSSENWLSLSHQNILLMHCERGGWPVLAFMLAGLLIYRKQYTGEQKTLDMIYRQAPRELLHLLSPMNPLPSQLRYLQCISRRNVGSIWPLLDRALTLDCVILRFIPNFDGQGGCRPIFRIYGQDPFLAADRASKVLFSTPKSCKAIQVYRQADCELVKIDIHCHIQGDVVLECISLDDDLEHEVMMFRVMFNTAFIRSNFLMLNRDDIDILWDAKDRFSRNFRAEVLLSEIDTANSVVTVEQPHIEDKDGLPIEAFAKVQEIFSNVSWLDTKRDAALHVLQQITLSNVSKEKQDTDSPKKETTEVLPLKSSSDMLKEKLQKDETYDVITKPSPTTTTQQPVSALKHCSDHNTHLQDVQVVLHHPTQPKISSQCAQFSHLSQVSSSNSLQSSPTYVSRHHSAPSAQGTVGITALLHDHAVFGRSEDARSMTMSPSAPSLLPGSGLTEPAGIKNSSPAAPSPGSQPPTQQLPSPPPLPPPPPPPRQAAAVHALRLTSSPVSTSAALPSSQSPMRNDPITPTSANLESALTIKAPSISLLTSVQPPSSLPLPSQPKLAPPQALPSSPPLVTSSRKPPFSSSLSPKSLDAAFSYNTSLPVQGKSSLPVKYKASSPVKSKASSPVKGKTSSPIKGQSTASPAPPPPLPSAYAGIISYALSSSPKTSVDNPPPPPPPPPPHPLPPPPPSTTAIITSTSTSTTTTTDAVSIKDMPFLASPPQPPPPPPLTSISKKDLPSTAPLPPPPPPFSSSSSYSPSSHVKNTCAPPSPPLPSCSMSTPSAPPPDPSYPSQNSSGSKVPAVPPPPVPAKGLISVSGHPPPPSGMNALPGVIEGRNLARTTSYRSMQQSSGKRTSLKPLHWVKVTRAMQGSLWAEAQKADEASRAPEFDISELESLFSAAIPSSEHGSGDKSSGHSSLGKKSDKVQLIDLRRANNCEIMLTKVKIPLSDLLSSVLALDDSVLDVDQVDNIIKFCPTKEEMDLLKNFRGDKESLGKCEQYFMELMKVPRMESKLRVFSFKIQFRSQFADLSGNLNIVNSAAQEIRSSIRLKRIMQTILSLGNALNQGTARGCAIGFRLDSLLKLTDTRARNNKMTLMHYLCKVLAEKLPELLDFPKDLVNLEVASKIQLKALAEEMQAICKGLEKVELELTASENDGPVSETFHKTLKEFLVAAEFEVRALTSLYSNVGRNADALALYFGEDPARCPFEQVISTLLNFVRLFIRAHEENCKQLELQKKKQQKDAGNEKMKLNTAMNEGEPLHSPSKTARTS